MTALDVNATVHLTVEVEDLDDADAIYTAAIERLPFGVELDDITRTVPVSAVS